MNEFRLLQDGGFVYRFVSKELNNNSTFTNSPTNVANHQSRDPLRRISNIKPLKNKKTIHKSCKLSDRTIRSVCKQMKESNTQDKQPSPGYNEDERIAHLQLSILQMDLEKLRGFTSKELMLADSTKSNSLFHAVNKKWQTGIDHIIHHAPEALNAKNDENKTPPMLALHKQTSEFIRLAILMLNSPFSDCTLADTSGNSYPILLANTLKFEPQVRVQANYSTGEALISTLTRGARLSATNSCGANLFHVLANKMAVELSERIIDLVNDDQKSMLISLMQAKAEQKTPVRIALDGKASDGRTARFIFAFLRKGIEVNGIEGQLDMFSRAILNKKFRTAEVCTKFYFSARADILYKSILTLLNVNAKLVQLLSATELPAKTKILHGKVRVMLSTLFGYASLETTFTNISTLLETNNIESCYKLEQEVRKVLGIANAKTFVASLSISDILTVNFPPSREEYR